MFALVDANAFYCSAERIFDPSLRNKPLVVLSNNDGNAISRTDEAKALGIRMGQPAHELAPFRRHGLVLRSANFTLYGDISARVVDVLREAAPAIEVYSIDESFLDVRGIAQIIPWCDQLRKRVLRHTGIPCAVGIGNTKTLAKLGNRLAKKSGGVCQVSSSDAALNTFDVGDVWGVGTAFGKQLAIHGIHTAAQLRDAPGDLIRQIGGVVLFRTQRELQGHPCLALEACPPTPKQIMVSRSFGQRVYDLDALAQALSTFAQRACAKLRRHGQTTTAVGVFFSTDSFRPEMPQYHPSVTIGLAQPTDDSREVLAAVIAGLRCRFRQGYAYKRAGVILHDLSAIADRQPDLFRQPVRPSPLMSQMDAINARFGRDSVKLASSLVHGMPPAWSMRQAARSPLYTTRIDELPLAQC